MPRVLKWLFYVLAALAVLVGVFWYAIGPRWRTFLTNIPADRNVLFWPVENRDIAFRYLDMIPAVAKARWIEPGEQVRALERGEPLDLAAVGFDLDQAFADQNIASLIVLQDGKIRLERYGIDLNARDRWTSFSIAKSVTSTLVGAALADGSIGSLQDGVVDYLPDLAGSAYEGVTLDQLLSMTSGVAWDENYDDPSSDVARFDAHRGPEGKNHLIDYMARLPREHEPGTHWRYSTGETNMIGLLVSSAVGQDLASYVQEKIWQPYGMEAKASWILSNQGDEIAGCCMQMVPRDYARLGLMALEAGNGPTQALIEPDWFAYATSEQQNIGKPDFGYGSQWWTYPDGRFGARGIFGQNILVDPQRQAVVVILSNWINARGHDQDQRGQQAVLQEVILGALGQ